MPTTAQAFRLEFTSPWNKGAEEDQVWSVKFHTTGTGMSSQGEADTHANDLADILLQVLPSTTSFTRYIHYPVNSTVNDYLNDYAAGTKPGTLTGYSTTPTDFQMLEVCHLWRCAAGKNSKGRTKYLFKYIHAAAADGISGSGADSPAPYVSGIFTPLDTGFGPNNLVACLPDGTSPSGTWELADRLYTRQLRRGTKKPKT